MKGFFNINVFNIEKTFNFFSSMYIKHIEAWRTVTGWVD